MRGDMWETCAGHVRESPSVSRIGCSVVVCGRAGALAGEQVVWIKHGDKESMEKAWRTHGGRMEEA